MTQTPTSQFVVATGFRDPQVWNPRNFAQKLGMAINWVRIYNRLFNLIDRHGESYFSGGRFIHKVREVDPYFPNYKQYMDERRAKRISTSRKDYFYEILLQFDEAPRMRIISSILDKVEQCDADLGADIRSLMGRPGNAPRAVVHPVSGSADRLNDYLAEMDAAIAAGQHERAVNLLYTCLEDFYTAFVWEKEPAYTPPPESSPYPGGFVTISAKRWWTTQIK